MPAMLSMMLCVLAQGFCVGFNSILQKKSQQGRLETLADSALYTTILAAMQAAVYCLIPPYRWSFPAASSFYIYTAVFAVGFFGQLGLFMAAYRLGPAAMTSTLRNLYILVPITLGLFLWNEPLTWAKGIGMALFVFATFFMNGGKYSENGVAKTISVRWLITSIGLLIVCGLCGSISKQVMLNFPNSEKTYLFTYNLFVVLIGLPVCVIFRKKAVALLKDKRFLLFVLSSSLCTVIADFIYVTFVPKYDSAFYMPLTSTITIIAAMLLSRTILKEKISGRALAAVGLCVIAVIILS